MVAVRHRVKELGGRNSISWAEQVEQEEQAEREAQAQAVVAGSQPLAGEDFNDDTEDDDNFLSKISGGNDSGKT